MCFAFLLHEESIPNTLLETLYFALVYPHVSYAIELYGNAPVKTLHKLNILNNKLLRILQSKPSRTNILELYKTYNTLLINKLHHF